MKGDSGPVSFTGRKSPARRPNPLASLIGLTFTLSFLVVSVVVVVLAISALLAGVEWAWNAF